jgi:hypothetical protein
MSRSASNIHFVIATRPRFKGGMERKAFWNALFQEG